MAVSDDGAGLVVVEEDGSLVLLEDDMALMEGIRSSILAIDVQSGLGLSILLYETTEGCVHVI